MALKGTIRDFGIADIFQLIGQQAKSGILVLRDDVDEVQVFFEKGAVARAESPTRPREMLLGSLLVNSNLLTTLQLDEVLEEQDQNLKRIGSVVVEKGLVSQEDVIELVRLQMTETVYKLFLWKTGTYEFEQVEVELSEGIEPIRSENILMEGIRMLDEWPLVRNRLPSYAVCFEHLTPLPDPPPEEESDTFEFSFGEESEGSDEAPSIGSSERRMYELIEPNLSLQKLIYLSRLGEFETCRALCTLLAAGHIGEAQTEIAVDVTQDVTSAGLSVSVVRSVVLRVAVYIVLLVLGGLLLRFSLGDGSTRLEPSAVHQVLSKGQVRVIELGLEVFRLGTGAYPERLSELVEAGVLKERDIRFPFENAYDYRVENGKAKVFPPFR